MSASSNPARLVIQPSDIDPATSISMPLFISQSSGGGYKVGVQVALSAPGSTSPGASYLYELDTGGKGFFAAAANAPSPTQSYGQVSDTYSSGNQFVGQAAVMNVSFPQANVAQQFPVLIGLIEKFSNNGSNPLTFPQNDNGFYGDFGASISSSQIAAATGSNPANDVSLFSVLGQLGTYGNGFIIDVGPYPGSGQPGHPQLIVGLTDTLRALFPYTIPMTAGPGYVPVSNPNAQPVKTYQTPPVNGTLTVGTTLPPLPVGILFDSGAPHTTFHTSEQQYQPSAGEQVTLVSGGVTLLSFQEGNILGVNVAKVVPPSPNDTATYVNTGIGPFFNNPILFDLELGKIGFPSALPPNITVS